MFKNNYKYISKNDSWMAIILLIATSVSISPLIPIVLAIKGNILSLIFCCLFLIFTIKLKIGIKILVIFAAILTTAFINSIYWYDYTFKVMIYFLTALIVIKNANSFVINKFVYFASIIHYWVLVLSFVGFLYAFLNGEPLFTIFNEDGRVNGFYLSTFSNTYLFGFIRPSGFYDEPGALSFYVCIIVALREMLGFDRKYSWKLILMGFITGSLTHFIFFILYAFHVKIYNINKSLKSLIISMTLVIILFFLDNPFSAVISNLISRFQIIDGAFAGDNRSVLFYNALSYLSTSVILFGLSGDCIMNSSGCIPGQFKQYGENPLTPLIHYGLTLSWVYYLILILIFFKIREEGRYISLGVIILLLQRPYTFSYGYTIIIILFLFVLYRFKNKKAHTYA